MPRTNTEIDKDLKETTATVAVIDKSLGGLQERVGALARELDLRDAFHRDSLKQAADGHERLRQEQARAAESIAELKTKVDRVEKNVEALQSRLWQLFVLILGSIIAAAAALGKDFYPRLDQEISERRTGGAGDFQCALWWTTEGGRAYSYGAWGERLEGRGSEEGAFQGWRRRRY